jgi:hypothetical protein
MPTSPIQTGIFTEATDRTAQQRWKAGNNVRFRNGLPEKIGGYRDINSGTTFLGICRSMVDWQTLSYIPWVGLGTNSKIYLCDGTVYTDITPIRLTTGAGDATFTTNVTVGTENSVQVTETGHGAGVGDYFTVASADDVGGLTLNGEWQVDTVIDADNFTFLHTSNASSAAGPAGGANTTIVYDMLSGPATSVNGLGFGAGTYSRNTYSSAASSSSILLEARTIAMDVWGEDLIFNPRGAGIYAWDASAGAGTPAAIIANAPTTAEYILVSPTERYLIAYGAHDGSNSDPMLVAWSDQEDYTTWTQTSTNTARSQRLDYGTRIHAAKRTRGGTLIFTDLGVYFQRYVGPPNVYFFELVGTGSRVASPGAVVDANGVTMWMGKDDFYYFDGTVKVLPCTVRGHVFDNINESQFIKVTAGKNDRFQEATWFYTSAAATENDLWVSTNLVDGSWTIGEFGRSAWIDKGELFNIPCATDENGILYTHEDGTDANGAGLEYSLESYDLDVTDGAGFMHISKLFPDYESIVGNHTVSLLTRQFPQSTQETKGPYTVTSATKKISTRARGRQIAFKVAGTELGTSFRMGPWNLIGTQHGRK